MSRQVFVSVIRGAHQFVRQAEEAWKQAVDEHGEKAQLKFPETAFALPMILALTGRKVQTLAECEPVLKHIREELLPDEPSEEVWLPYLGAGLDAGAATMFAQEITLRDRVPQRLPAGPGLLRLPERHGHARDRHPARGRPHAGLRRHPGAGAGQ